MRRIVIVSALLLGCGDSGPGQTCGPTAATVTRVIDGDTVELSTGETIRYLLIDTPELNTDCYGPEAQQLNASLVEGQAVTLVYDEECTDRFGRLLAYVSVGDREINRLMVERGYACVLFIPPNGAAREDEFLVLEAVAKQENRGMWGACPVVACD